MRPFATLLLLLFALPALAQTPGNCEPGTARGELDISDVRARLFTNGNLFYGEGYYSGNGYLIPKFSGIGANFAANLWVGGMVENELRVAAATFSNFDFWPGPLEPGATLPNPDDCSAYDRIWVVSTFDVQQYEQTGIPTANLAEWPVDLGAEVIDGDGVAGNYNLAGGDRPRIYGSQTAFWVMNDVGGVHPRSDTPPIGLEMQVTAFAIASPNPFLNQATFYRIRLINRNTLPLDNARFSIFVDTDLGDVSDEYQGVDTTRALGYYYNASETDSQYGIPPAAGLDFLSDGLGSFRYAMNASFDGTNDPNNAVEFYRNQFGLWNDGTPMTALGNGYGGDAPVTVWAFPGDPVTAQCWSDINACDGEPNVPGNHRIIPSSPTFSLAPGESKTFDVAYLFAQGESNLDSITELRAASDLAQAAYDAGTLFDPVAAGSILPAPALLAPAEGALFVEESPRLQWSSVPGAEGYTVRVGVNETFEEAVTYSSTDTESTYPAILLPANEVVDVYWQVRAEDSMGSLSPYAEPRSFQFYRFESNHFGDGIGVIETSFPDTEVCPADSGDPGCAEGYPGNTVWLSPNSTGDYVLTNPRNELLDLLQYASVIDGDDLEVRFSEACAEPGACLSVYASAVPLGTDLIASVPFELWNTGAEDDPDDNVRMIPILRALDDADPTAMWDDTFPAEQDVVLDEDTLVLPVTQRVLGVMPDRPNGYDLFADAAVGFGGPGAMYDPENDGDDQIETLPESKEPCRRQNYYVDFCYQGASTLFVAPIGGLYGIVLADLAGDGTTPPVGTTIRFDSNERLLEVSAEDDAPVAQPQALTLDAPYPNPFRGSTTVNYRLEHPADVRLAVYDVLGRRVAMLVDDAVAAGTHRATFESTGLASGIYLVVLEADGERVTRKVLLTR
jgi:hypothetical protein